MRALVVIVFLSLCYNAYAARVLQEKSTGKLLEYQSDARPGALIKDYTDNPQYGYTADQIEEKEVTPQEWAAIQKKWIDDPAKKRESDRIQALEQDRQAKEDAIRQKLNLTQDEFKTLRDSLEKAR